MADQMIKSKQKRRDLFQNAAITKNLFDIPQTLQQYTDQAEESQPRIVKTQSAPVDLFVNKSFPAKQLNTQIKRATSEQLNHQHVPNAFIFQGSSDQDSHNQKQENESESEQKIIFQLDFEQKKEQYIDKNMKTTAKTKRTIQVFGEKIQVENDADSPTSTKLNSRKTQKEQQQIKLRQENVNTLTKKQLLKSTTIMPENTFAKMKLIRSKSSQNGLTFAVYLQSNMRFILACKKASNQSFILSDNPHVFQENGHSYQGKVKTSFFGNQILYFSQGLNPQNARQKNVEPRQLLCTVITKSQQILEQVKPRDFTVYLLKSGYSYYRDLQGVKMYNDQISLDKLYQQYIGNRSKILMLQNRKSKWNDKEKMHSLNMKGRAKLPSIKNFILENEIQGGRQVMLLGKMEENEYSFDIHYPLSPVLGMAIALSSFVHKTW